MASAPCPNCGRPVDLAVDAERPFCSERCRLIDLGAWLTEGARSIPGERAAASVPEDDAPPR